MWAALKANLAKDLNEFAAVVTTDTQRLVEGAGPDDGNDANTPGVVRDSRMVTGDEPTPEATVFTLLASELAELQSSTATYALPLSAEERAAREAVPSSTVQLWNAEHLLRSNETVRDQHAYLVVPPNPTDAQDINPDDTADASSVNRTGDEGAPQLESRVSHDAFFDRYFTRLLLLRRAASAGRRVSATKAERPLSTGWSDTDDSAPGLGTAGVAGSVVSMDEREAYGRRIAELEQLVAALGAQVEHLQAENATLRLKSGTGSLPAAPAAEDPVKIDGTSPPRASCSSDHGPRPSSLPSPPPASSTTETTARGIPTVVGPPLAIEDDDWATLS